MAFMKLEKYEEHLMSVTLSWGRKPSRYADNFHSLRINYSVRLILSFHLILSLVLSLACQTGLMAVRNLFDNI